jgi:probable F420-dependent oxidoreductase
LGFVLESDAGRARELARSHIVHFLELANYSNNLREFGFSDEDFVDGGSDRLVDSLVAWGDAETIAARVGEYFAAGADHVCLQPLHGTIPAGREALRALEPALPRPALTEQR